jgi:hypothetical protein
MFDESQHLVARTLDPTNSGVVWDKFYIYQGHRVNTPYIQIGTKRKNPPRLKLEKHPNAIKRALHYKELLDSGQVDSQGELARLTGTPRSTISAYLRLLRLAPEIQSFALDLEDADDRHGVLTESRLRYLVALRDPDEQREQFGALMAAAKAIRRVR